MNSPSDKRITMREIARLLDISHATVSRALKDDPRISKPVRQKVKETAKAMGFQPDPMLAALSHYRRSKSAPAVSAALGWINCWPQPEHLRAFKEFDLYWQGAVEEAGSSGYRIEEFHCPCAMSPTRLKEILLARGIRGILLPPSWSGQTPDWHGLPWEEFCMVRFGYSLDSPLAHVVTSDQTRNGTLAFQKIWDKGYRRIGMVTWKRRGTTMVRFSAGFMYGQLAVPNVSRLPPLMLEEPDERDARRDLLAWLHKAKPDAILTDLAEIGEMLADAGYRVLHDIGLATLSVLDGKVDAGIFQNSHEIGAAAVQALISLIHHNQRGIPEMAREILIPGRWMDGPTLPPIGDRQDG